MSKRNIYLSIAIVCFALTSTCFADPNLPYKSDELLIRFSPKEGNIQRTVNERNQILAFLNAGEIKHSFKRVPGLTLVKLPENLKVADALIQLKGRSEFLYVEPNWKITLESTEPNDEFFANLWGLHQPEYPSFRPDADIDAPEAWDVNTTSSITVAVLDTGVDYTHPDLAANIWTNANGYHGYDFVNDSNYPLDDVGHGTHCAGIIGGVGNNGIGVSGVAWKVKIMALKFINSSDIGWSSDAIKCIEYAIDNGAKVLNNSYGWYPRDHSPYLEDVNALWDAIEDANAAGVLFIASAGNRTYNNDDPDYAHYPSNYPFENIIAVMATTEYDGKRDSSNWGHDFVDLGAPGQNIKSCWRGNTYRTENGTSMAAAHVSGACALVWSQLKQEHPDCNYMDVKARILNGVDKLDALKEKCVSEGRLNVNNAVRKQQGRQWSIHNVTKGGDYSSITGAALAADHNDIIKVDQGHYYERAVIGSKRLTIKSTNPDFVENTIIDCYGGTALSLSANGGSLIEGLIIANCRQTFGYPGTGVYLGDYTGPSTATVSGCRISCGSRGIWNSDSNVVVVDCLISDSVDGVYSTGGSGTTVRNCKIENCSYGIYADSQNSFTVCNNIISGKTGSYGIYLQTAASSSPQIYDNLIYRHYTGIDIRNSQAVSVTIRNNTIFGNNYRGVSFTPTNDSSPVSNCIIWGNATEINPTNKTYVSYCCVEGGFTGGTNFGIDPCFVAPDVNNFHLKFDSNCVDAANPSFNPTDENDIDGDFRNLDGDLDEDERVDIGADEYFPYGDFNYDGIVNFKDFAKLAAVWNTNPGSPYDLNNDNSINYNDLEIFVSFWLYINSSYVPEGEQMQGEGLGDSLELDSSQGLLLLDGEGEPLGGLKLSVDGVVDPNGPIVLEPNETVSIGIWGDGNAPPYCYYIGFDVDANASLDITYAEILYEGDTTMIEMVDDTESADLLDISNPFIAVELIDMPMNEDPLPLGPGQLVDDITFAGTGTLMLFDGEGNLLHSIVFTSSEP